MKQAFDLSGTEYLCVERSKVQHLYEEQRKFRDEKDCSVWKDYEVREVILTALRELFGDKCLPDKTIEEKAKEIVDTIKDDIDNPIQMPETMLNPKPKFKVGDKVRVSTINTYVAAEVVEVNAIYPQFTYRLKNIPNTWFAESTLEPYTEENKETMLTTENGDLPNKEKELNLVELLTGCEGEWFYVTPCGEMELKKINKLELKPLHFSKGAINCLTKTDGRAYEDGSCIIYPSRALYEKYPLDAYSAWMEWKEAREPKHTLQAQIRLISNAGKTIVDYECIEVEVSDTDLAKATEAINEVLQKLNEKNTEQ